MIFKKKGRLREGEEKETRLERWRKISGFKLINKTIILFCPRVSKSKAYLFVQKMCMLPLQRPTQGSLISTSGYYFRGEFLTLFCEGLQQVHEAEARDFFINYKLMSIWGEQFQGREGYKLHEVNKKIKYQMPAF